MCSGDYDYEKSGKSFNIVSTTDEIPFSSSFLWWQHTLQKAISQNFDKWSRNLTECFSELDQKNISAWLDTTRSEREMCFLLFGWKSWTPIKTYCSKVCMSTLDVYTWTLSVRLLRMLFSEPVIHSTQSNIRLGMSCLFCIYRRTKQEKNVKRHTVVNKCGRNREGCLWEWLIKCRNFRFKYIGYKLTQGWIW